MSYNYKADKDKTKENLSKCAKNQEINNNLNNNNLVVVNKPTRRGISAVCMPTYKGILEGLGIPYIFHYKPVNIVKNANIRKSLQTGTKTIEFENRPKAYTTGYRKNRQKRVFKILSFLWSSVTNIKETLKRRFYK